MCEFPAMPLWTDAYLADTHPELSLEEHGCYLILMMAAWRRPTCSLPDDDAWFCRFLGIHGNRWRVLRKAVLERFFTRNDAGDWEQKRQRKERDFVEKRSTKARDNVGKRWAQSKENKHIADTDVYTPTPTPTPKQGKTPTPAVETPLDKTETQYDAPAPSGANVRKLYAWEGRKIRLLEHDYLAWKASFSAVDLNAELLRLDIWLANEASAAQRDKWFILVSGSLAKLNRAIIEQRHAAQHPPKVNRGQLDWASDDPRWASSL